MSRRDGKPNPVQANHRLEEFRIRYRSEEIGQHYSGLAHLGFTTVVCLAAIAFCFTQLRAVVTWEWLAVPVTFLIANFIEYAGHRGPMHRPRQGLGLVFKRHTGQHHAFFSSDGMAVQSRRDYKAVLFPPVLVLFFFGVFALPIGALLALTTTANIAWLFAATAVAYFLNYEWLHLAYHSAVSSPVSKLPGIARLRQLHQAHHDPALMLKYNFNITYPIADHLFGTYYRHDT